MPVNTKLLAKLKQQYGKEKGERVYFAMENKGHKATKPGAIAKAMKE